MADTTTPPPALDVDAPVPALEIVREKLARFETLPEYMDASVKIGDLRTIERHITTLTTALRAAHTRIAWLERVEKAAALIAGLANYSQVTGTMYHTIHYEIPETHLQHLSDAIEAAREAANG